LLEQPPQETAAWFPLLALLVSGGHTCLVEMASPHEFKLLGQTLDDAAGEALDKGASLLGLGYPGGPAIQKAAVGGDANRVRFPRGLQGGKHEGLNFSFSGVKTALRYYVKDHPVADDADLRRDVTASYQHAVVDALVQRVGEALKTTSVRGLACAGGVARNTLLRERLADVAARHGVALHLAAPDHCTDNAAMIAGLAGSGMTLTPGPVREIDPNLAVDTPFEYRAN
jgi:N6-L-threonylcarbamoyladenine synthase